LEFVIYILGSTSNFIITCSRVMESITVLSRAKLLAQTRNAKKLPDFFDEYWSNYSPPVDSNNFAATLGLLFYFLVDEPSPAIFRRPLSIIDRDTVILQIGIRMASSSHRQSCCGCSCDASLLPPTSSYLLAALAGDHQMTSKSSGSRRRQEQPHQS
jgi:hypothetical protein